MKCVCCKRIIDKKESRTYALGKNFSKTRKKHYGCQSCTESGTFDSWVESHPEKLNQADES